MTRDPEDDGWLTVYASAPAAARAQAPADPSPDPPGLIALNPGDVFLHRQRCADKDCNGHLQVMALRAQPLSS